MGRETILFSSKDPKSRQDVSACLRDLADRVETGRITLRQPGSEIYLDLPGEMVLEIKVEAEEKRRKGTQRSREAEMKYDGTSPDGSVELA
jgi:amphi-Trp domain-containing protein